jgi:tetratricopeptide (TPR) repeat protein
MKREHFKPKWNEPCLCGSDKKYRDCCHGKLQGFDIGKKYEEAINKQQFERALIACRADIVQYTIWHRTNTEPALLHGAPVEKLLRIDVNALADYVERLRWLYFRTDRSAEWLSVLDHLRENIRHPKWQRKIGYIRSVTFLGPNEDRAKAKIELDKIGAITPDDDDVELLQLYLDLHSEKESFSTRLRFADRIIALSKSPSDQLQYRGLKASQYLFIGDRDGASKELSEAILYARKTSDEKPLSDRSNVAFGQLLQLLGSIKNDREMYREAIEVFRALLLKDNWTDLGRASLSRAIGETYKYSGAWDQAEHSFREALAAFENPLDRIHLAECLLYQKKIKEASTEILSVDISPLKRPEHDDYVFAYSTISLWSGDKEMLTNSKKLLEQLEIAEPYFKERRMTLLLNIVNALANESGSPKTKGSLEDRKAATASDFILLQPNFMGIGINFNAIFDYMLNRKRPDKQ